MDACVDHGVELVVPQLRVEREAQYLARAALALAQQTRAREFRIRGVLVHGRRVVDERLDAALD